jgi:hypothetical protein
MVTTSGMYQRCYSRKLVFEEGVCPCALYKGEILKVPKKILDELFPKEPPEIKERTVALLPSQMSRLSYDMLEEYATRAPKKKKQTQKKSSKLSLADLIKTTH